jgi:hypothetical protein
MKIGALVVLCSLAAGTAQAQVLMPNPLPGELPPPNAPPGVPAAPEAGAATAPSSTFGNAGQVLISEDFKFAFLHTVKGETSSLLLAPAIDVFVANRFSLGGQIRVGVDKAPHFDADVSLGLGLRLGFTAPLSDLFAIYPRAGLFYNHLSSHDFAGNSVTDDTLALSIDVPFLFIPVPHFFIGLAPELIIGLAGKGSQDVSIGLLSLVGGYFDW